MTEYRKGDRMLVDGNFMEDEPGSITVAIANNTAHPRFLDPSFVHPHPGVPLADVMEELELLWYYGPCIRHDHPEHAKKVERMQALKDARLAANKPKEVWLKGHYVGNNPHLVCVRQKPDVVGGEGPAETINIEYYPEDIRETEP